MSEENTIGRIATLWRFPLKSMRGERIESAQISATGLPGDRAYALVDVETGEVVSAKKFRRYPGMFGFRARFIEPPEAGKPAPPITIELPDGQEVRSDAAEVEALISARLGREVRLAGCNGHQAAREKEPFHDAAPVSVLTNSTLRSMGELQPGSVFDARRFRMNLVLDCEESGFPENDWVGRTLRVGQEARLFISKPDARCVMTTLAQDELPEDRAILTGLARHNRLKVGDKGSYPCAGVYARVLKGGEVNLGDPVVLEAA